MIREEKKINKNALQNIPAIVKLISLDNDVLALYGFGSIAHGVFNPLSDLDFGVLLKDDFDKSAYFGKQLELIGLFNDIFRTDEIDLVLMNDAPLRFCHNIIKTGKLLYCREKREIIDFQERLIKLYLDFKYFRDSFDESFLKGVGYHGKNKYHRGILTDIKIRNRFEAEDS
jgi:predicted nucleotidyltransferase